MFDYVIFTVIDSPLINLPNSVIRQHPCYKATPFRQPPTEFHYLLIHSSTQILVLC